MWILAVQDWFRSLALAAMLLGLYVILMVIICGVQAPAAASLLAAWILWLGHRQSQWPGPR